MKWVIIGILVAVYLFETIDVYHKERHGVIEAIGPPELLLYVVIEVVAVVKPRKLIMFRQSGQLRFHVFADGYVHPVRQVVLKRTALSDGDTRCLYPEWRTVPLFEEVLYLVGSFLK